MLFEHGLNINNMDPETTIVVDVDDTILSTIDRDYPNSIPNQLVIDKLNDMYENGWMIILFTARGHVSFNNDKEKIDNEVRPILIEWLERHKMKYDYLIFGKPIAKYYLDDKALRPEEFIKGFSLS